MKFRTTFALLFVAAVSAKAQVAVYHAEGNYNDSSGNGRTATVVGTVGFRASLPGAGQGFDVDNVAGAINAPNYLTVPGLSLANASALSGTGLSITAIAKEDNFANNGSLVNLRDPNNDSGFTLEPAFQIPGSYLFVVFTASGAKQLIAPGFTVGDTYHIAAVFDPANQLMSVYRDGQLVASTAAGSQGMRIDNDETLMMGRNAVNTDGFDGLIDEVSLYSLPLSPAQVAATAPEPGSVGLLLGASLMMLRRRAKGGDIAG